MRSLLLSLAGIVFSTAAFAQVPPGDYIGTVAIRSVTAEIWIIDPETRKATQATGWNTAVQANCITMFNASLGWVGTVTDPSDVYRISLSGTTITPTKLNTNPIVGGNIAQIVRIGAQLYFTTNSGTGTSAKSLLYSMPLSGGAHTQVIDLSTQTGWRAGGLANAVATDGSSKVWIAIWTVGEIWEVDVSKTPAIATQIGRFPGSKQPSTSFFPVHMHYDSGKLTAIGLYTDVAVFDVNTKTVASHYFKNAHRGTGQSATYLYANSGFPNSNTGDMGLGSRSGSFHVSVPTATGQLAERDVIGIGSTAAPETHSVNGLWYSPDTTASTYSVFDEGCAGTGGAFPTSVGRGTAKKGNASFSLGVDSCPMGQNLAVLLIGGSQVKLPLQPIFPAGCNLLTPPVLIFATPTDNQNVDGWGSATLPLPLPNIDIALVTQWLIYHAGNSSWDAVSDGRILTLK